jgi:hypothetical protein
MPKSARNKSKGVHGIQRQTPYQLRPRGVTFDKHQKWEQASGRIQQQRSNNYGATIVNNNSVAAASSTIDHNYSKAGLSSTIVYNNSVADKSSTIDHNYSRPGSTIIPPKRVTFDENQKWDQRSREVNNNNNLSTSGRAQHQQRSKHSDDNNNSVAFASSTIDHNYSKKAVSTMIPNQAQPQRSPRPRMTQQEFNMYVALQQPIAPLPRNIIKTIPATINCIRCASLEEMIRKLTNVLHDTKAGSTLIIKVREVNGVVHVYISAQLKDDNNAGHNKTFVRNPIPKTPITLGTNQGFDINLDHVF